VTFALGAVLGKVALLDRGPRSATIAADEDLAGFGLSAKSFDGLCTQQPDIAIRLLAGHDNISPVPIYWPSRPSLSP